MISKYTDAHIESAIDLYELRLSWLDETDIHANAFEGVEERLCASIYHCGRTLNHAETDDEASTTENKKEPSKEGECFVLLASQLNAPKPQTSAAGYKLAYQWLTLDAAKSAAAEAALSLYPDTEQNNLLKFYDEQEVLRPTLMRIFRKQMFALPIDLVNSAAALDKTSAALQLEALNYAAARADIGLELFRAHYVPVLSGKTQFDTSVIAAALWGGMVRSDPDASKAIGAALSHAGSAADHAKLMRLAALTGHADFLPLLLMAAENNPDSGYPLLVLFGQKSVMPELLKALESAHTMEQAATAFSQLTDQFMPRVPRLSVVGEEEDDEETPEQIPDVRFARTWWAQHQAEWKADERWLFGKPANAAQLVAMSKKYAGKFGCDVLALLALSQKSPLNIPWEIWRARQQQCIIEMLPTQPVAKAQVKPASARHA